MLRKLVLPQEAHERKYIVYKKGLRCLLDWLVLHRKPTRGNIKYKVSRKAWDACPYLMEHSLDKQY
jgi:hypothetical protein